MILDSDVWRLVEIIVNMSEASSVMDVSSLWSLLSVTTSTSLMQSFGRSSVSLKLYFYTQKVYYIIIL